MTDPRIEVNDVGLLGEGLQAPCQLPKGLRRVLLGWMVLRPSTS